MFVNFRAAIAAAAFAVFLQQNYSGPTCRQAGSAVQPAKKLKSEN